MAGSPEKNDQKELLSGETVKCQLVRDYRVDHQNDGHRA